MSFSAYDKEMIMLAKVFLDQQFPAHVQIEALAHHAGMSETRFKIGFKILYGESVYAYQLGKRLEKAYALLEQTREPIKKIARETGFKQSSHFRKAFKQKYGVPPGALRNKPDMI